MAKIKSVQKIKKLSPISKNLKNQRTALGKGKSFNSQTYKKPKLSLSDYIKKMKLIVKAFVGKGLRVSNFRDYLDEARYHRMRKQLRAFYITAFKDGTFKFIVKSSGLGEDNSYKVELKFKNLPKFAKNIKATPKELVNNTPIAVRCSCDDYRYRLKYYLGQMGADLGKKETRPPNKTNPNQEHLFLCKHLALVLVSCTKPSFYNNPFKRYVNNIRRKDKRNTVKILEKDKEASHRASLSMKHSTK